MPRGRHIAAELRDECLNQEIFFCLKEAQIVSPPKFSEFLPERSDPGLGFTVALGLGDQHADPSHAIKLLRARDSGQTAAAPQMSLMNSRRLIASLRLRTGHFRTLFDTPRHVG
jgi:hypothetical protein